MTNERLSPHARIRALAVRAHARRAAPPRRMRELTGGEER
jgi:hypothetical protein